jgi:hypothetical protein
VRKALKFKGDIGDLCMSLLNNTSDKQLRASGLFDMDVELRLSLRGEDTDSGQGTGERTFGFIMEKSQAAAGNS